MKASKDGPKLNLRLLQGQRKDDQDPQAGSEGREPTLRRGKRRGGPRGERSTVDQGVETSAIGPAGVRDASAADDAPPPPADAPSEPQDFAFEPEALDEGMSSAEVAVFSNEADETEIPPSGTEAPATPSFLTEPDSLEDADSEEGVASQENAASASRASASQASGEPAATQDQTQPSQGDETNAGQADASDTDADADADADESQLTDRERHLREVRRKRQEARALALAQAQEQLRAAAGNVHEGKAPHLVGPASFPGIAKKVQQEAKAQEQAQAKEGQELQPATASLSVPPQPDREAEPEAEQETPARLVGRTVSLVIGFFKSLLVLALIVGPMLLAGYYYFFVAAERYEVSTVFLIRTAGADTPTVTTILGQSQAFGRAADESFSVVDYVNSYEGLIRLEELVDLRAAYSVPKDDPFYYLPADSSLLDLHDYFQRMVDAYYDQVTGLVTIDVRAFTPEDAVAIAAAILTESERLVNEFNTRAQADLLQLSRREVAEALTSLEEIEQQLTAFRQTHNVIDPIEVITRVNGIIAALEGEIAKAEAELLQLSKVTGNRGGVVRLELEARIEALRLQVERERQRLVGEQESLGTLIPQFELLGLRKELAGQAYSAALASMQSSIAQAQRQQLYVVPVVAPAMLDEAQLPDRWESLFFVFLVVLLVFTVGRLLVLGVRDHIL